MIAVATLGRPVVSSDDPGDLAAIRDPGCALAIWDRPLDPVRAAAVAGLDLDALDDLDATIPTDGAALHAAARLGAAGYAGEAAVEFATDIAAMVAWLVFVMPCTRVRVRLEVIDTDACRRFHADLVTLRLIATWRGPGTQWIATQAPDAIAQIATGAVALFKGRLLAPEPTVLHRSPPIAGTGARRLVLVVDPIVDVDDPGNLT